MTETDNQTIDHDGLFKEVIKHNYWDFLKLFYPQLLAQIDTNEPIALVPNELRTRIPSFKQQGDKLFTDITGLVLLKDGERIIINIEPQSSYDSDFPNRIRQYNQLLNIDYQLRVASIAILSYEDRLKQPLPNRHRVSVAGVTEIVFEFAVIQLVRLQWRDYVDIANPVIAAFMAKMGSVDLAGNAIPITEEERPLAKAQCYDNLLKCNLEGTYNKEIIVSFIESYLKLNNRQELIFQQQLENKGIKPGVEMIKSQFRLEGEAKASREFVNIILRAKSITVNAELERQLSDLKVKQLKQLGEAAVNFKSQKDLENWLTQAN